MTLPPELRDAFQSLRLGRRADAEGQMSKVREAILCAYDVIESDLVFSPILWRGRGVKNYKVATPLVGSARQMSRPVNWDIWLNRSDFENHWDRLEAALPSSADSMTLSMAADAANRVVYSGLFAFAIVSDIYNAGDRGGPGTFFEMIMGPILSRLMLRVEAGAVDIEVPGTGEYERIPVDLSFWSEDRHSVLVAATKISTRERISQAFVHDLILQRAALADGKAYKSILIAANETNVVFPSGSPLEERLPAVAAVQETLVPGTILLYHKYVSPIGGLFYLDPPLRYVNEAPQGFPHVATVGQLLTRELPGLLAGATAS